MTHHAPESLDGSSRCLGWCCSMRNTCQRYMQETEVLIRQWFLPHHPGEECQYYVEDFDGEE